MPKSRSHNLPHSTVKLGIADLIDANMPKSRSHNLPHSTVIKAMCLNGLGFNESRLYLYSDYFENLPTERLLGKGILPEHINDDVLGRTLDKIYEHGCTELFNKIVLKAMKNVPLDNHILPAIPGLLFCFHPSCLKLYRRSYLIFLVM